MNKINSFRDDYEFLSNFYPTSILYKGLWYRSSEAAFQAQKCIFDSDKIAFTEMSASEAKHAGRKVALRKDWEAIKIQEMTAIVRIKFKENSTLAEKLLATGNAQLEEGNTWGDRFWGTVNGIGANHLGKILMQVRKELHAVKEALHDKREDIQVSREEV